MRFKKLIFILSLFITLIIFTSTVFSDVVEITIEYDNTTTSTTTTTTGTTIETTIQTTTGGGGNGGSGTVTTIPIEVPKLTYSMPASIDVHKNEKKEFTIKVTNVGNMTLHDIKIDISGISKQSYSVSPINVNSLDKSRSTYFTVSIDAQNIAIGSYTLRVNISSKETYEGTNMILNVKEITEELPPTTTTITPEEEKVMRAGIDTIKILTILAVIIAVVMATVYVRLKKKTQLQPQPIENKSEEIENNNKVEV